MSRIKFFALLLCVLVGPLAYADHNPLLPRPQQIQYGSGSIPLQGMGIAFSSSPSSEDRFAAEQLSSFLTERTGLRLPVQNSGQANGKGPAILLEREGPSDPLALPGEKPGPGSREAYDLTVTADGVKIHARSTAGIYYGVQTLRQLV